MLDGAPYFRSSKVTELEDRDDLDFVQLPSYSPDMNSVEECWRQLKASLKNRFFEDLPDCSEDQLLRVIWYCETFPLSDPIEDLFIAVMTEGADNFREAEAIQRNIISALISSPMGGFGVVTLDRYQRELETVRNWQNDQELPPAVRNFARRVEQDILDQIEQWDRFEEDLI